MSCLPAICMKEKGLASIAPYHEKQRGRAFLLTSSTPFTLASLASHSLLPSVGKLSGCWLPNPCPAPHRLHLLLAGEGTSPSVRRSLLVWGEVGVQWAHENIQIPGSHLKCLEERALGSKVHSDLDGLVFLTGSRKECLPNWFIASRPA